MRISILTLVSVLFACMMTSCYYQPIEPVQPVQPVQPLTPRDETLINEEAQRQLEQARQNMGIQTPTNNFFEPQSQPTPPTTPTTYPYAKKVSGRPGFIWNPYTKNLVDVRGIPQGTLVRDPYDNDAGHKFRVP